MAKTKEIKLKEYVPMKDALELVKKEKPWIIDSSIRQAVRDGKIDHRRVSDGPKAKIRITAQAILDYLESIK